MTFHNYMYILISQEGIFLSESVTLKIHTYVGILE